MTGDFGKVGEARIDLKVNTDAIGPGMAKARAQVDREAAKGGGGSGGGARSIYGGLGKIAALLTGGGVAAQFYKIGQTLSEVFESTATKIKQAIDSIDVSSNKSAISDLESKIAELNALIANKGGAESISQNIFSRLIEVFEGDFQKRKDALEVVLNNFLKSDAKQRKDDRERDQLGKLADVLNKLIDQQRQQVGPFGVGQTSSAEGIAIALGSRLGRQGGRQSVPTRWHP